MVVRPAENAVVSSEPDFSVNALGDCIDGCFYFLDAEFTVRKFSDSVSIGGEPDVALTVAYEFVDFCRSKLLSLVFMELTARKNAKPLLRAEPGCPDFGNIGGVC